MLGTSALLIFWWAQWLSCYQTLAGVCLHECHGVKKSKTYKWHTRYFAPAEKVSFCCFYSA
jgi:hypothetical protein